MKEAEEILQQLVADLDNLKDRVSGHLGNALFEINRAIQAIQRAIKDIQDNETTKLAGTE